MINYFDNVFSKNTDTLISPADFVVGVMSGRWESFTKGKINQETKKKIPCVTVSGSFKGSREKDNFNEHSGLICIDIDDVAADDLSVVKGKLLKLDFTYAVFKSVSGTGLAWIVRIDPEKHALAFDSLSQFCFETTGYPTDHRCKDVSRLRLVSYDPDAFFNPEAKVFKKYIKVEDKREYKRREATPNYDRYDKVLSKINTDILDDDYSRLYRIGCAIASHKGESGVDDFLHICSLSAKYGAKTETQLRRQYKYCSQTKNISIGTFYYYAAKYNFLAYDEADKLVIQQAVRAKKSGRNASAALEIISQFSDLKPEEVDMDLLQNAYDNASKFESVVAEKGSDKKLDIDEVAQFLSVNYKISRNVLTQFYELDGKRLTAEDMNSIYLSTKKAFESLPKELFLTIVKSDYTPAVNPVVDYLGKLDWDGIDRIELLVQSIKSCTGDLEYQKRMVTRWMLGFFQNLYSNDACPLMMVITGIKNSGKTWFFKHLLPVRLDEYFGTSQHDRDKDDDLLMTQKLLILDDEFSGKSKQDAKKMKRLLSASYFDLRPPYGAENVLLKRIAVLCGTCNEPHILNDPTGNRRFVVFEVNEKMDWELYNSVDKQQLFAQIKSLWDSGMTGDLTVSEIEEMESLTDGRHSEVSVEAELIIKYFDPSTNIGFESYTNTEIKVFLEKETQQRLSSRKLGLELKRLGYEIKTVKKGGKVEHKYTISKSWQEGRNA